MLTGHTVRILASVRKLPSDVTAFITAAPGSCYYILQAASGRTTGEALAKGWQGVGCATTGTVAAASFYAGAYSDLKCLTVRSLFWLLRLIRRNDAPWRCPQQRRVGPSTDPSATCTVLC